MRLTFEIDEDIGKILERNLPHGMRKYAYRAIINGFAKQLEADRAPIILALAENKLDTLRMIEEASKHVGSKERAERSSST